MKKSEGNNAQANDVETRENLIGQVLAGAPVFSYGNLIASMLDTFAGGESVGIDGVRKTLSKISVQVKEGNMGHLEELLLLQVELLNHAFMKNIAFLDGSKSLSGAKVRAEIALKAQNQSRRTILAIAELKNPKRATFIKNNAVNQQINVGDQPRSPGEEAEILEKNQTNKLFGGPNEKRLDTGEKAQAKRGDPPMETMGTLNGAKK